MTHDRIKGGNDMTDDFVQVNVRMTRKQRDQLRTIAEKEETSMNQFIIDRTFHTTDDRTDDRKNDADDRTNSTPIIELLKKELEKSEKQLDKKDEQIDKLQKTLDQQQQLTLQTNQQIERLQLEKPKEKTDEKKGFFARLFNTD
ncbi:MAG: DUF536 domain-containing protein [Staphylococcus equorum]|nr:DUF536 domain-containing protein [Staphylococcus equorum]